MKTDKLLEQFKIGAQFVAPKSTLPVLACVLITRNNDGDMVFASTDLSAGVVINTGEKNPFGEDFCVPAKPLLELLASYQKNDIELSFDPKKQILKVVGAKSLAEIKTMQGVEFPPMKQSEIIHGHLMPIYKTELPSDRFCDAIEISSISALKDNSRPILQACHIELGGDDFCTTCADGFRLSHYGKDIDSRFSVDIPASSLASIIHILDKDGPVILNLYGSMVTVANGNMEFLFVKLEGNYPDYRQVIPKENKYFFSANRDLIFGIVKRARVMVNAARQMKIIIDDGNKVSFNTWNPDCGEFNESIESNTSPFGQLAFALSVDYLIDAISKSPATNLHFEINSDSSPIVITSSEAGETFKHTIMPMMLS